MKLPSVTERPEVGYGWKERGRWAQQPKVILWWESLNRGRCQGSGPAVGWGVGVLQAVTCDVFVIHTIVMTPHWPVSQQLSTCCGLCPERQSMFVQPRSPFCLPLSASNKGLSGQYFWRPELLGRRLRRTQILLMVYRAKSDILGTKEATGREDKTDGQMATELRKRGHSRDTVVRCDRSSEIRSSRGALQRLGRVIMLHWEQGGQTSKLRDKSHEVIHETDRLGAWGSARDGSQHRHVLLLLLLNKGSAGGEQLHQEAGPRVGQLGQRRNPKFFCRL